MKDKVMKDKVMKDKVMKDKVMKDKVMMGNVAAYIIGWKIECPTIWRRKMWSYLKSFFLYFFYISICRR